MERQTFPGAAGWGVRQVRRGGFMADENSTKYNHFLPNCVLVYPVFCLVLLGFSRCQFLLWMQINLKNYHKQ